MESECIESRRKFVHVALAIIYSWIIISGFLNKLVDLSFGILTNTQAFFLLLTVFHGLTWIDLKRNLLGSYKIYGFLERDTDLPEAFTTAMLGFFIVTFFFRPRIAAAATLVHIADPVSSIIGKKFGQIPHPLSKSKYIEGNLAGATVAATALSLIVPPFHALVASTVTMLVEGVDLVHDRIDDNLTIPVVAAVVLKILEVIA